MQLKTACRSNSKVCVKQVPFPYETLFSTIRQSILSLLESQNNHFSPNLTPVAQNQVKAQPFNLKSKGIKNKEESIQNIFKHQAMGFIGIRGKNLSIGEYKKQIKVIKNRVQSTYKSSLLERNVIQCKEIQFLNEVILEIQKLKSSKHLHLHKFQKASDLVSIYMNLIKSLEVINKRIKLGQIFSTATLSHFSGIHQQINKLQSLLMTKSKTLIISKHDNRKKKNNSLSEFTVVKKYYQESLGTRNSISVHTNSTDYLNSYLNEKLAVNKKYKNTSNDLQKQKQKLLKLQSKIKNQSKQQFQAYMKCKKAKLYERSYTLQKNETDHLIFNNFRHQQFVKYRNSEPRNNLTGSEVKKKISYFQENNPSSKKKSCIGSKIKDKGDKKQVFFNTSSISTFKLLGFDQNFQKNGDHETNKMVIDSSEKSIKMRQSRKWISKGEQQRESQNFSSIKLLKNRSRKRITQPQQYLKSSKDLLRKKFKTRMRRGFLKKQINVALLPISVFNLLQSEKYNGTKRSKRSSCDNTSYVSIDQRKNESFKIIIIEPKDNEQVKESLSKEKSNEKQIKITGSCLSISDYGSKHLVANMKSISDTSSEQRTNKDFDKKRKKRHKVGILLKRNAVIFQEGEQKNLQQPIVNKSMTMYSNTEMFSYLRLLRQSMQSHHPINFEGTTLKDHSIHTSDAELGAQSSTRYTYVVSKPISNQNPYLFTFYIPCSESNTLLENQKGFSRNYSFLADATWIKNRNSCHHNQQHLDKQYQWFTNMKRGPHLRQIGLEKNEFHQKKQNDHIQLF